MRLILPADLESRVAEEARAEGVSPEAYVERLIRQATAQRRQGSAALPLWSGCPLSDLRREHLYDDVR
jgi:hypothetical protein